LVVEGHTPNSQGVELYDMVIDPEESQNLADEQQEQVDKMQQQLKVWQQSVLESLTGADYK